MTDCVGRLMLKHGVLYGKAAVSSAIKHPALTASTHKKARRSKKLTLQLHHLQASTRSSKQAKYSELIFMCTIICDTQDLQYNL